MSAFYDLAVESNNDGADSLVGNMHWETHYDSLDLFSSIIGCSGVNARRNCLRVTNESVKRKRSTRQHRLLFFVSLLSALTR